MFTIFGENIFIKKITNFTPKKFTNFSWNWCQQLKLITNVFTIFGANKLNTPEKLPKLVGKYEDILFVNIGIFTMFGEFDQSFTKFDENNITKFSFTKLCDIINTGFVTQFGDSPKLSTNQQTTEFSPSLVYLIKISPNLVKTILQHLVSPSFVTLTQDFSPNLVISQNFCQIWWKCFHSFPHSKNHQKCWSKFHKIWWKNYHNTRSLGGPTGPDS